VIGESAPGISVSTNVDLPLLLLYTLFVQYLRKIPSRGAVGRLLLGPVLLILGSNLPKRRDHRDRLNFIKRFMSVCFGLSLLGWLSAVPENKGSAGVALNIKMLAKSDIRC
jgi:hypothetical protein